MNPKMVLVVEDDENSAELLATFLQSEGYAPLVAHSLADARQQLVLHRPSVVLLDLLLPDGSGMDLFADESLRGTAEIVLITGNASIDTSIEALRLGAADYLIKPVSLKLLASILQRLTVAADDEEGSAPARAGAPAGARRAADADRGTSRARPKAEGARPGTGESERDDSADAGADAPRARTKRAPARAASAVPEDDLTPDFYGMVGDSPPMLEIHSQIRRVARTSVSVFVVGESGTGKELVAQAVHQCSRRKSGPFEAVNCGAISSQLIESELFGHEKGSFTGAIRQHRGFFERAGGGTLFLDEITEMPMDLQVKLLRVLETATFSRVGSDSLLRSDVRIVAATNRDPFAAIREGKLREDLYYRLNVFQIDLPPLRDRLSDVPRLASHFLSMFARKEGREVGFDERALAVIASSYWPGNIRELRNFVHRAAILTDASVITADMLPPLSEGSSAEGAHASRAVPEVVSSDAAAEAASVAASPAAAAGAGLPAASAHPAEPAAAAVAASGGAQDAAGASAAAAATGAGAATGEADEATLPQISVSVGTSIAEMEKALILATLEYAGGAKERTADLLGISLKTLYNRLRSYEP